MKVYAIKTPEQLKRAADMAKWQEDQRQMRNRATVWSASIRGMNPKPFPFEIYLEIGRSAVVMMRNRKGEVSTLGNLYVVGARDFAKEELELLTDWR